MRSFRQFLAYLLSTIALFFLVACVTDQKKPDPAPTVAVGQNADAARSAERSTTTARDSKQIASLEGLLSRVPDLSKEGWESELGIMRKRYGDTKATEADKKEAEERLTAWVTGQVEPARALAATALGVATEQAHKAEAERLNRIAAEAREVESRKANEKAIKDRDEEINRLNQAMQKKQVAWLNGIGLVCIIATGVLMYFGPRSLAALSGLIAVCCFGMARLISKPWFETAFNWTLVGALVIGILVGVYEWRRKSRLREEAEAAARRLKAGDDVIAGVESVRALLKKPSAELIEKIRTADTTEKAMAAMNEIKSAVSGTLSEWVTEEDGTAAVVDERRRAMKLLG